jgi:predicted extracellular nuclease
MNKFNVAVATAVAALSIAPAALSAPSIEITEVMYQGGAGEFFEFTNVTSAPIDMTGWSFDDDSRVAGTVPLSIFGVVAAGESVVITEAQAADFRTAWGLPNLKVLGGNTTNIGRGDEINIYDASNTLVDRLRYDDATLGNPRTQGFSMNTPFANLADQAASGAFPASFVGDAYASRQTTGGLGNPGVYSPVPEPASLAMIALSAAAAFGRRRHRSA